MQPTTRGFQCRKNNMQNNQTLSGGKIIWLATNNMKNELNIDTLVPCNNQVYSCKWVLAYIGIKP